MKDGRFYLSERASETCPYRLSYLFHDILQIGLPNGTAFLHCFLAGSTSVPVLKLHK
jgi:hypothetical protein